LKNRLKELLSSEWLRLHGAIAMVGFWGWGIARGRGLATEFLLPVILMASSELVALWFLRSTERRMKPFRRKLASLNSLSIGEARRLVEMSVELPKRNGPHSFIPEDLAPSVREFLESFDGIELGEGTTLAPQQILPSHWNPGFWVIGSGTCEIISKAGDDRVWEVDRPLNEREIEEEAFRSIWHYLLINATDALNE
jgi:hypothetical protein